MKPLVHHHQVLAPGSFRTRAACDTDRWYRQGPAAWMRGRWKVMNTFHGWLVFRAEKLQPNPAYRTGAEAMAAVGEQDDWMAA